MSITFNNSMIAAGLALAVASLCAAPSAFAAQPTKPVKAKTVKAAKGKPAPKADPDGMPAGPDADITGTTTTEYSCELGNKLTIFHHQDDESHIALRWKKRIHRLEKVGTTTGARRFENRTFGLIWIGIPAKGMLLDSKLNRQLANECKNADQEKADLAPPPVPAELPSVKVKEVVEPIVPPMPQDAAPAVTPQAPGATPQAPAVTPQAPGATPQAPAATPQASATQPAPLAPQATPTDTPAPADKPQDSPAAPEATATPKS
jgi:hypothetical protein